VLLDMGEPVGVAFADLDLARITDVRSRLPALSHRRDIGEPALL
jgi:predicted amidohydrolase